MATETTIESSHGSFLVDELGTRIDADDPKRPLPQIVQAFPTPEGIKDGCDDILNCWLIMSNGTAVPPDMDHFEECQISKAIQDGRPHKRAQLMGFEACDINGDYVLLDIIIEQYPDGTVEFGVIDHHTLEPCDDDFDPIEQQEWFDYATEKNRWKAVTR